MKVVNNGLTIEIKGALGHFPKEFVVSALEKQIPKKPFVPWDSLNKTPYCPNCEENVWGCDAYCDHCGQALDWGDTE